MALPPSPVKWKPSHVREWLSHCGFGQYAHLLCDIHKIDGTALLLLTEDDLKNPPLKIEVPTNDKLFMIYIYLSHFFFYHQILGDIKNLALHLSYLRSQHKEEFNKICVNQGTNGVPSPLLALPYTNNPLGKKKPIFSARQSTSESVMMRFQQDVMRTRESSPVFSESSASVDEFNCKPIFVLALNFLYNLARF